MVRPAPRGNYRAGRLFNRTKTQTGTMSLIPSFSRWRRLTGHNAGIYALAPGDEPGTFFSAAGDGWVARWALDDPENGRLVARAEVQLYSLAYFPLTQTLVAGDMNGGVHWLNLREERPNQHFSHHRKGVFGWQVIDDQVISIGGGGMLTRWDGLRQRSQESLRLSNQALRALAYSEERRELAVGSSDHAIYLLDAETLAIRHTLADAHDNSVFALSYHPSAPYLLSGGRDAQLKVWSLEDEEPRLLNAQPAHWFTINDIAFAPGTPWFFTGSRDKTIKVWDAESFQLRKVIDTARDKGHVNSVNRLLWLPEAQMCVSASDDRSLILWK